MVKKALSNNPSAVAKRLKRAQAKAGNVVPVVVVPAVPVAVPVIVAPANVAPVAPVVEPVAPVVVKPIAGLDTVNDLLVTTGDTWNARFGTVHPVINHNDATYPFFNFEYKAEKFPRSRWSILRCTDNGQEVGVPFDDSSYFVFDNAKTRKWIDVLQAGIERQGLQLVIKTAGTLRNRGQQFTSFEIVGLDKLQAGGREIRSFLSLLKAIDKSMSFTLVNSTITVCCKNTFKAVKDDTGAPLYAKVKFTRNAEPKIDEVPKIVECFISGNNALLKKLNHWHSIGVTPVQAEQMFAAWLGNPTAPMSARMGNIITRLKELHVTGKGNKGETALDAFNAVTEYYTHESAGDTDSATKQFESSEIGTGAENKALFFDYLTKAFDTGDTFTGICKVGESILVAYNKARIDKAAAK